MLRLKNLAAYWNNTSLSGHTIRPELRFTNYADMEAKLSDMVRFPLRFWLQSLFFLYPQRYHSTMRV